MKSLNTRVRTLILLTGGIVFAIPAPADAGLLDWMFPRRRQRVTYYYTPYGANYVYTPASNSNTVWTNPQVTTMRPIGLSSLQACGAYTFQPQTGSIASYRPVVAQFAPAGGGCNCAAPATTALSPVASPTVYSAPGRTQAFTGAATVTNYGGYATGYAFSPGAPSTAMPTRTLMPTTTVAPTTAVSPTTPGTTTYSIPPNGSTVMPPANNVPWRTSTPQSSDYAGIPWKTVSPQPATAQPESATDNDRLSPLPADRRPTIDPELRRPVGGGDSGSQTRSTRRDAAPLQPIPYLPPQTQASGLKREYSDLDWLDDAGRSASVERWNAVPISWNTEGRRPAARLLSPEPIREESASNPGSWESLAP